MPQYQSEELALRAIEKMAARKLYQNAYETIEENLSQFPESKDLRILESKIASEMNDFLRSVQILEELDKAKPNQVDITVLLSQAYLRNGDSQSALDFVAQAESLGADQLLTSLIRAECYERTSQSDLLSEAVAQLPPESRTINIRARALIAQKDYEGAIDLLSSGYETGGIGLTDQINNLFMLAKAYDRTGEYDKAWDAATKAHEIDNTPFDLEAHYESFASMKAFLNDEMLDVLASGPKTEAEPFFIVGSPRSGTSLLEQILSMHPDIENAGESCVGLAMQLRIPRLTDSFHSWPTNMIDLRKEDIDTLSNQYFESQKNLVADHKVVSNKSLNLSIQLGFLSKVLPSSRAVMLHRHPLDNAVSCYTTNLISSGHGYTNNLSHLASYWVSRKKIADYWLNALDIPMMELHYENLVADQRGETERLIKFLDLPWHEDCMEFHKSKRVARTISYDQVNQKMYNTSSGRWKNYEKHLGPVIDIVSDYL
ncbi:MAG: hypothetical protein CMJ38_02065 [Phycisphaerae bacterium]|nr:hypothetical protein [Phycisphaerae bacterium]